MGRSNSEFHGVVFSHTVDPMTIFAHLNGEKVGRLELDNGMVSDVSVHPNHRRKGIAKGMWDLANKLYDQGVTPDMPHHAEARTEEGDAWAKAVGGYLPPLYQGDGNH